MEPVRGLRPVRACLVRTEKNRGVFVRDIQRYVPAVTEDDVRFGPSGIRAQALGRNGRLLNDFVIEGSGRIVHVVNAPSPGATASLAIGRHVAGVAAETFGLVAAA